MNPILQPGMHPDADALTAFAEQLLPAKERDQILAHMGVCGRCREVVFLAQQAAVEEPGMATAFAREQKSRMRWMGGWRWGWIPAGAFAVLIGVATFLHFRGFETPTQIARNDVSREALQQPSAAPATAKKQPDVAPRAKGELSRPHELDTKLPAAKTSDSLADEKNKALPQRQVALGVMAPPLQLQTGVAGGSIQGEVSARAQATPNGGPVANQMQQNAMQQSAQQQQNFNQAAARNQRLLQSAGNSDAALADKSVVPRVAPAQASQTVTVNASTVDAGPKPATAAPAPQLSAASATGRDFEVSAGATSEATLQLKKATGIVLPGGAPLLSMASAAGRTIAIDTTGALFLREEHEKKWQSVTTQWTGRAVLVRTTSTSAAKEIDALQAKPLPQFELVNDKLQTWTSVDGKVWTARPVPNQ